jgi:hypothetical protein
MILREKRIKIWYLIRRVARKLGVVDIPRETEMSYWTYMRQPDETVRYLVIDYSSLDTDFFYHAYEESDLKGTNEQAKIGEMYEHYFKEDEDGGEELLLIDIQTMKAYTLSKEIKIKYIKKEIK